MNSFDDLLELGSRYQISRIFLTACELKIFTYIANGVNSIDEISKKTGFNKRALDIRDDQGDGGTLHNLYQSPHFVYIKYHLIL
jgi:hypothetical protein